MANRDQLLADCIRRQPIADAERAEAKAKADQSKSMDAYNLASAWGAPVQLVQRVLLLERTVRELEARLAVLDAEGHQSPHLAGREFRAA